MDGKATARRRGMAVIVFAVAVTVLVASCASSGSTAARPGDPCGVTLPKPGGGVWKCTFDDDFTGSTLDASKWVAMDSQVYGWFTGDTCDSPHNITVRNGALQIWVRKQPTTFTCRAAKQFRTRYTGGSISTHGRFSQTDGRFEIRAEYPTTRVSGIHGAYWLFPAKPRYGKWPGSGEIDVAEWWSKQPEVMLPTLHYPGAGFWTDSGWHCHVDDVSQWHTYDVEWTPRQMRFLIDGAQCWQRVWTPQPPLAFPQPFDQPFDVVLTMGVDAQNHVDPSLQLPQVYQVDYVKVWK